MKKERFTIDAWLQDMSRKVVDEDGDSVDPRVCSLGWLLERQDRLFLVTPEPELSEFEERIFKLLRQYKEFDIPLTPENIKAEASMLWPDFEKYFFDLYGKEGEGDSALRSFYYRGLADGKAKALKDLPRWRKCDKNTIYNTKFNLVENGVGGFLMVEGYQIGIDSLKKLPGFKEDEK